MYNGSPNVSCFSNKSPMISKKSKPCCARSWAQPQNLHIWPVLREGGRTGHRMWQGHRKVCSPRRCRGMAQELLGEASRPPAPQFPQVPGKAGGSSPQAWRTLSEDSHGQTSPGLSEFSENFQSAGCGELQGGQAGPGVLRDWEQATQGGQGTLRSGHPATIPPLPVSASLLLAAEGLTGSWAFSKPPGVTGRPQSWG